MSLLLAIKKSQDFSCICPYDVKAKASGPPPGYAPDIALFMLDALRLIQHFLNHVSSWVKAVLSRG